MGQKDSQISLSSSLVGHIDVARLLREMDALENYLEAVKIRAADSGSQLKMPKTSRLLDDMLQQNDLDPLNESDRLRLKDFLLAVKTEAPRLHMSFSGDPPAAFVHKLVSWLRQEIHPSVLLQVGLQPGLGAGVILRTTNKQFDLSLRQRFIKKREVLLAKIRETTTSHERQRPVEAAPGPAPAPESGNQV